MIRSLHFLGYWLTFFVPNCLITIVIYNMVSGAWYWPWEWSIGGLLILIAVGVLTGITLLISMIRVTPKGSITA